jgi:hypothetical protein
MTTLGTGQYDAGNSPNRVGETAQEAPTTDSLNCIETAHQKPFVSIPYQH